VEKQPRGGERVWVVKFWERREKREGGGKARGRGRRGAEGRGTKESEDLTFRRRC